MLQTDYHMILREIVADG